jgi:hypothetical protein
MADSERAQTPLAGATQVPDLIDTYRSQRQALLAKSRDLLQLRQEIRVIAEREADDIVNTTRRNIRQILIDARGELLVLAAQVQAAIDEPAGQGVDDRTGEGADPAASHMHAALDAGPLGLAETRDLVLGARQGMHEIVGAARPHLDALADEARALRATLAAANAAPQVIAQRQSGAIGPTPVMDAAPAFILTPRSNVTAPWVRVSVIALALIATAMLLYSLSSRRVVPTAASAVVPQPSRDAIPAAAPPALSSAAHETQGSAAADAEPSRPSLTLEARRDVWIRTTVDGRADAGRLLHAGDTREITDAREVAIRAGDAGALWTSLNGAEPTSAGRDGEVVTRHFTLQPPDADKSAPPSLLQAPVATPVTEPEPERASIVSAQLSTDATPPVAAISDSAAARTPPSAIDESRALPESASGSTAAQVAEAGLASAAEQWFDAYYTGGKVTGPARGEEPRITDERRPEARLPLHLPDIHRSFDEVRLQFVGIGALYTARMSEQALIGGNIATHVSRVSQLWMRGENAWRLVDVRIVDESALQSIPR